jgi:oligopeptidase B
MYIYVYININIHVYVFTCMYKYMCTALLVYIYIYIYMYTTCINRNVYVHNKGGLNDPRVAYWEPAKWVAKIRELKTDNNRLIFKTDMSSGHFSASDR